MAPALLRRLFRRGRPDGGLLAGLTRRLEEAVAYFAVRSDAVYHTRTAYLGDDTVLALLHGRLMMYLDTRGVDLAPHVMMFGHWEPPYTQAFLRLVRPGDTVLDIGAHLGVYAVLGAAATGPAGQVHAFEPNARFAALLRRSLSVNGFAHARVHEMAVGAAEGVTELRFTWDFAGGAHLATAHDRQPGWQAQPCRVAALDDVFPDPAFTLDVVKMDVEGFEASAVKGMVGLLARSPRVRVMFEFAPQLLRAHGSSPGDLVGLLASLGFRFWRIGDDSRFVPVTMEALAAAEDGLVNLLACREAPERG